MSQTPQQVPEDLAALASAVEIILKQVGEDPSRDGLVRTPQRVAKSLRFLTSGYRADVDALINEAVQPTGFLGYVQGTGKEPKDGQPVTNSSQPDFEDYGLGCFLLAGSEVYRLSAGK